MTKGLPSLTFKSKAYRWMGRFAKRRPIAAKTIRYSAPTAAAGMATLADLTLSYGILRASLAVSVGLAVVLVEAIVNRFSKNIQIEENKILRKHLQARADDIVAEGGMRYEVIEELGRGAQAIILLVRDNGMRNKPFRVLKVPRLNQDQLFNVKQFLDRLKAEAANLDALKQKKHPRIVELVDLAELSLDYLERLTKEKIDPKKVRGFDKFPCIVMERVKGQNLKDMLAARKKEGIGFRLSLAIDVFLEGVSALKPMKETNVIHRDIKPENIVMTEEGIKIIDFGISRGEEGTGTIDSATLGSEGYMAPEQRSIEVRAFFQEKNNIEKLEVKAGLTDQFGLAATVWELLTLETPFAEEENILKMELPNIESKLEGHPDRLIEDLGPIDPENTLQNGLIRLRSKLIENLNLIFQRTLAIDPKQRYESLEELEKDLNLILKYNNSYQRMLKAFNRFRPALHASTPSEPSEGTAVIAGFHDNGKKEGEK
jgi:serine/threonine protein kinase